MLKLPRHYDIIMMLYYYVLYIYFFWRNITPNYLLFFWLNKIAKLIYTSQIHSKSFLRPWELKNKKKKKNQKKRSWVQILWSAVQTPASPLPMSLTWGFQWLVGSSLLLCFKNKIKQNKIKFIIGHTSRPQSTSTINSFHWTLNNKP